MLIMISIIMLASVVNAIAMTLIFIQIRSYLMDYYANAKHTGVEVPNEEYEGSNYLNDDTDVASILNMLNDFKSQINAKQEEEAQKAEAYTQPSSFFDLFSTGVEVLDDSDKLIK